MSYPPAPWHLYGKAFHSVHLVDLERAKAQVPSDLEIVSVLPGKTLGGLYLSVYDANSTLNYHELIATPALVRYQGTIGSWISHIYVDHPESMAGGRQIWGLPKEMADFTWSDRTVSKSCTITVQKDGISLCQAEYGPLGVPLSFGGKTNFDGTVFGGLTEDILAFQGQFEARLKWMQCRLDIPDESPFAALHLGHPWFSVQFQDLYFVANVPSVVGQWTSKPSRAPVSSF